MSTPPGLYEPSAALLERTAFQLGIIRQYLMAYDTVMGDLEASGELQLLKPVVNTLLNRMAERGLPVADAAQQLLGEMQSERSKPFVMAAAIDIALNERPAGGYVEQVPTRASTYAI